MAHEKVLLVDDDDAVRFSLGKILELHGFQVSTAANVPEALRLIAAQVFDVLLSDLHMPGAGDGLTVVSAMRHANPESVTLLHSAFPQMTAAVEAILLQTDEILIKPINVADLLELIESRLVRRSPRVQVVESVASILMRTTQASMDRWYERVEKESKLMVVTMTHDQRCAHLPQVFLDLEARLTTLRALGSIDPVSSAAVEHGANRYRQGYSAAMLVEESRLLQVSIFETLQKNLAHINFSILLIGVMTIADEVDSQLSQAMDSYIQASTGSIAEAVV